MNYIIIQYTLIKKYEHFDKESIQTENI